MGDAVSGTLHPTPENVHAQGIMFGFTSTTSDHWMTQWRDGEFSQRVSRLPIRTTRRSSAGTPAPPSGWVHDATFQVLAHDSGLGIQNVSISSPQASGWQPTGYSNTTCTGAPTAACPADVPLSINTAGLPAGAKHGQRSRPRISSAIKRRSRTQ